MAAEATGKTGAERREEMYRRTLEDIETLVVAAWEHDGERVKRRCAMLVQTLRLLQEACWREGEED